MTRDQAMTAMKDVAEAMKAFENDMWLEGWAGNFVDAVYDGIYRVGYAAGHKAGVDELMGMHKEHD